jgi:hypothetical protein
MDMYDTEAQKVELRRQQERLVHAWMRAAAYAEGSPAAEHFSPRERPSNELDTGRAAQNKNADNLALGQALISIGLIGHRERPEVHDAQDESDDLARSLLSASSIRSRLGEILVRAKRITSGQLEFALELQRNQGGLLGEILVSLGWLDRETLDAALAAQASGKRAA